MISTIFGTIKEALTGFISVLSEGLNSITALFYDAEQGGMTFFGTLLLIGAGVGLVYWVFYLIRDWLRVQTK